MYSLCAVIHFYLNQLRFSKQTHFRLPSARHQVMRLVWKSSDGGQQMHRKCFWSNMSENGRWGIKWAWLPVHARSRTSMCLCLGAPCLWLLTAGCAWGVFLARNANFLQYWVMVVVILLSPGSSVSWCHMWPGRRVGGLFVMWYCSLRRLEMRIYFFMNREEGCGNSCMPDQLALLSIVKFFFFPPQLFLYGPLKWADASTLLPRVPFQEYFVSHLCEKGNWTVVHLYLTSYSLLLYTFHTLQLKHLVYTHHFSLAFTGSISTLI